MSPSRYRAHQAAIQAQRQDAEVLASRASRELAEQQRKLDELRKSHGHATVALTDDDVFERKLRIFYARYNPDNVKACGGVEPGQTRVPARRALPRRSVLAFSTPSG